MLSGDVAKLLGVGFCRHNTVYRIELIQHTDFLSKDPYLYLLMYTHAQEAVY